MAAMVLDQRQRPMQDLRISLTDRCNFRCTYCMPRSVFGARYPFLKPSAVMNFDEIRRLAEVAASLGANKIRLTGGEPLLRHDVSDLVKHLSQIEGIDELTMTTNGSRLSQAMARQLKAAGLTRITVSLDALDDGVFGQINDVGFSVKDVLRAIDHAQAAQLTPVKINMVVRRSVNADQILPMAEAFRHTQQILRFIEFMDVGNTNHWNRAEVVPAGEIFHTINERWPLTAVEPTRVGEVARRFRYQDGQGEIGIIASVSAPFCRSCSRARLSAEGRLYLCLFAEGGLDLLTPLRQGASDPELRSLWQSAWSMRRDQYSVERATLTARPKVEMSHIGG